MRSFELIFAAEWDERKTDECIHGRCCLCTDALLRCEASSAACMKVSVFLMSAVQSNDGGETADTACQKTLRSGWRVEGAGEGVGVTVRDAHVVNSVLRAAPDVWFVAPVDAVSMWRSSRNGYKVKWSKSRSGRLDVTGASRLKQLIVLKARQVMYDYGYLLIAILDM